MTNPLAIPTLRLNSIRDFFSVGCYPLIIYKVRDEKNPK